MNVNMWKCNFLDDVLSDMVFSASGDRLTLTKAFTGR
jgi:hypothetical protein